MKKSIFTVLLCFMVLLLCPASAKADLVYEPGDEISSELGETDGDEAKEKPYILVITWVLVAALVVVTGILIWFFFGRNKKK